VLVGSSWYDKSDTTLNRSVSCLGRFLSVDICERLSSSLSSGSSNGDLTSALLLTPPIKFEPDIGSFLFDRTLVLRQIEFRTLVSRDIGGTLRGRYGGGGSSPNVSEDASLRWSVKEMWSDVSMPV